MTKDLKEELKAVEKDKLAQTLTISITADGTMSWSLPNDMTIAVFLHKQIDVILGQMINAKLQRSFEQTPKIIKPNLGII